MILPFIEIYLGCTDAEQNVDALMLICCGTLAITKMIWLRIYASNFTKNWNSALNDYLMIENEEQRTIMHKHTFIARVLLCSTISVSYLDCAFYLLIPIFGSIYYNQANITNEDITLEYTVPSRCSLKYLNMPDMHKTYCLIEFISMILASTSNYGNIYLLRMCSTYYIIFYLHDMFYILYNIL